MAATISRPRIGSDSASRRCRPIAATSGQARRLLEREARARGRAAGRRADQPDGQIVRPGFRTDFGRAPRAPGAAAGSGDLTAAARVFFRRLSAAAAHDVDGMTERKPNPPRAGRENRPRARRPSGPEVHAPDGSSARPAGCRTAFTRATNSNRAWRFFADALGRISRFSREPADLAARAAARGQAALPGLVNVHSHAFHRVLRGRVRRAAARGRIATIARWPR